VLIGRSFSVFATNIFSSWLC